MKKNILFFVSLFVALTIQAQQKLSYAYDAAGNRISRTIVVGTRSVDTNAVDSVFFEEQLAQKQIKIYPNPVKSELSITVSGYDASLRGEFILFSISGSLLYQGRITGETTQVNMGNYSPGVYLLHLILKGEKSVWKVIKE